MNGGVMTRWSLLVCKKVTAQYGSYHPCARPPAAQLVVGPMFMRKYIPKGVAEETIGARSDGMNTCHGGMLMKYSVIAGRQGCTRSQLQSYLCRPSEEHTSKEYTIAEARLRSRNQANSVAPPPAIVRDAGIKGSL